MSVDIKLKRVDKVYVPGETVSGYVVVTSNDKLSHNGIQISVEGAVTLQLSARAAGIFETFYNQIEPLQMVKLDFEVRPSGKLPAGVTELPFEFTLEPVKPGDKMYETYQGVFVNIRYTIHVDIPRPMLSKRLKKSLEFIVELPAKKMEKRPQSVSFTITPDSLENVKKTSLENIPRFKVTGVLDSALCPINKPFTGELVVEECDTTIRSIEAQLVRIETTGSGEQLAKEPTEIQNIQLAEGDVCRGLPIPIYMIFPRLFTCPTVNTRMFKVEFEVNLVILFDDGHLITENFPIKLFRSA